MLPRMSGQVLHIAVDVNCADEPIQGNVSEGARQPQPFYGWIGLIGALDGLLGSPRQDRGGSSAGTPQTERRGDATD